MAAYTYRANDDDLEGFAAIFTSRAGDGMGDSEECYHDAIRMAAACKAKGRFLDIGSGLGRIIEWLQPYATSVTGLEPDLERFSSCSRLFDDANNVQILHASTGGLSARARRHGFDLITASMVIQHVSTRTCRQILVDLRNLLADQGVAIVATTHFPYERFTYQADPASKSVETFDRYADNSDGHDSGLPVRLFSRSSFLTELDTAGLTVVAWQQFSYPRTANADGFAALYGEAPGTLRDCGISQFALVRRSDPRRRRWWEKIMP